MVLRHGSCGHCSSVLFDDDHSRLVVTRETWRCTTGTVVDRDSARDTSGGRR
jgi:hypothetical protein